MFLKSAATVAFILSAVPAGMSAQEDWTWRGNVASGKTMEIRNLNGSVSVLPGTGSQVVVTATRHARKSDIESVTMKVIEHADGVTICSMYPTPENAKRVNECLPGGGGSMSNQNNDVNVNYVVRVPAGVKVAAHTVNGGVSAEGLSADVDAGSVNGSIDVSTRGQVSARTVNGSIRAAMGASPAGQELKFSTVNGGIQLDVPADFAADVSFSSVNGEVETDFPITIEGSTSRGRLRGRIGTGGPRLTASTVNGDLTLRRR